SVNTFACCTLSRPCEVKSAADEFRLAPSAGLQYPSDKKAAIARASEGRAGENEGGDSSFNMAADK
ncbi:hypothetical protein JOQ06_016918, partial [Pogonophryne albipinna]